MHCPLAVVFPQLHLLGRDGEAEGIRAEEEGRLKARNIIEVRKKQSFV